MHCAKNLGVVKVTTVITATISLMIIFATTMIWKHYNAPTD